MKSDIIEKAYAIAKERYAAIGVDTDKAIEILEKVPISLHCWQTDDVVGFERNEALSGGIQTTGNYPGRARNIDEVRQDISFAKSLLAGNHRLNGKGTGRSLYHEHLGTRWQQGPHCGAQTLS